MAALKAVALQWLCAGQKAFPAMLEAIGAARDTVRLETYIFEDGRVGREFLLALVAAAQRGARVTVLVDAFGSWLLPNNFFDPLRAAGGEVKYFNPLRLRRLGVRNHRKLLVCDQRVAFVGGFNLADDYDGDGVTRGWYDLGVRLEGELAGSLAGSFDEMVALAGFSRKPLLRLRAFKRRRRRPRSDNGGELCFSQPGSGPSPIQHALRHDLASAREVSIITAYFLPPRRLRRDLMRIARHGGRVRLILAGKSDVLISLLAARNWYRRLLRAGVEIYEYQPQILHAKLIVCDHVVYVGSANLDVRSLKLNYELMLRLKDRDTALQAREIFDAALPHCRRIELEAWVRSRSFWQRLQGRWANFLLARVDPFIALRQFRVE